MAKKPRGPIEMKPDTKVERLPVPPALPMERIAGHAGPKRVLMDSMSSGRVHHCWIFQGPEGVGKFTTAMSFAALLLDPSTQRDFSGAFSADEGSTVQRLMRAGSHPDLHVIVKELAAFHPDPDVRKLKQTNIPLDVVRDFLIDPATRAPNMSGGGLATKVFVIDGADSLAFGGQNALLKTLEEPPPGTVLMLVTASDEKLLPTIRSRSQRVSFAPLSPEEMRRWVGAREISPTGPELEWLLKFADGSPGVFEAGRVAGLYSWWEQMGPMMRAVEKGEHRAELATVMWDCVDGYAAAWVEKHPQASKEAANKAGADWMFRIVAAWAREGLARAPVQGAARIDAIRDAERRLDANVNGLFVMEELVGRLTASAGAVGV